MVSLSLVALAYTGISSTLTLMVPYYLQVIFHLKLTIETLCISLFVLVTKKRILTQILFWKGCCSSSSSSISQCQHDLGWMDCQHWSSFWTFYFPSGGYVSSTKGKYITIKVFVSIFVLLFD